METLKATAMQDDLVSVIIPVYNSAKYLPVCLGSVVAQTYRNLEIVLVDDGSTDGSGQICDEWAEKDSRIRVLHCSHEGQSYCRNTGLRAVTGTYVCWVDSDDYIHSRMIEILHGMITEHECDLAVVGYRRDGFSEEDETDVENMPRVSYLTGEELLHDMLCRTSWSPLLMVVCNKMYRREVIQGCEFGHFRMGEDVDFNARVYQKGTSINTNSL